MNILEQANKYVKLNSHKVDNSLRYRYHFSPQIGWMNDPNGFCFYKGYYHMFYQYYPYKGEWGLMHWGHAISKDLVNWEHLDVALAPSNIHDKDGCFSGNAIVKDDVLYLFYTGHRVEDGKVIQTQHIAYSRNGLNFIKHPDNPIVTNKELEQDFRDPYVYEKDGSYYMIVGSHRNHQGCVIKYKSENLINWEYVNEFTKENLGTMWECPSCVILGNKSIMAISPQNAQPREDGQFFNISSSLYMVIEDIDNKFTLINYSELDLGFDFYAPIIKQIDNKLIMVAWMNMWGRNYLESKLGYAGTLTLPRVLELKDDLIYQHPIETIYQFRKERNDLHKNESFTVEHHIGEYFFDIDLRNDEIVEVDIGANEDGMIKIIYSKEAGLIEFARINKKFDFGGNENEKSRNGYRYRKIGSSSKLKLHIFIDTNSVEIFINDGKYVFTSTNYYFSESVIKVNLGKNSSLNGYIYKY